MDGVRRLAYSALVAVFVVVGIVRRRRQSLSGDWVPGVGRHEVDPAGHRTTVVADLLPGQQLTEADFTSR
jgi:hypothetical protein